MTEIEYLKTIVCYNPSTGELTRPTDPARGPQIVATRKAPTIMIDRKTYTCGRLAWALAYGEWPAGRVYFVDGNKQNNALSNLTLVKPNRR
jgi:hypothetical protein